jgi:hypothetical protein
LSLINYYNPIITPLTKILHPSRQANEFIARGLTGPCEIK